MPLEIPERDFLADFNHRVKVFGKSVYNLATLAKRDSEVTNHQAERIKTNWGSMLKQIRHLDWNKDCDKIKKKVLAPIEHLFDNHEHCDASSCLVLKAKNEKNEI